MSFVVAKLRKIVLAIVSLLACVVALFFLKPVDVGGIASAINYDAPNQNAFHLVPTSLPKASTSTARDMPSFATLTAPNVLQELHSALSVMQTEYFSLWLGKWTTAIDWTAAVAGTHMTSALHTLSSSLSYTLPGTFDKSRPVDVEAQMVENEINRYFGQSITYFFGEDHFSIRMQAYDDMLWVVLGWLDSVKFIDTHSDLHYTNPSDSSHSEDKTPRDWHGKQFIPAFAHRARVFYELAEQGWDWRLCGGGMTWNPRLLPYKNAITNELFIAASVAMYHYFPGDDNCSPFMGVQEAGVHPQWTKLRAQEQGRLYACDASIRRATYDPIYLTNAIHGYEWLKNINMTNELGLYVDGFHIGGYARNHSKTTCNERNEMVYTYNQGVVLSGLRGLWEGTNNITYLSDGHELIRNVIRATGWTDTELAPTVSFDQTDAPSYPSYPKPKLARKQTAVEPDDWAGLGSHGILSDLCDPYATCSQDAQTFKGIFFHHLTSFCSPLPTTPVQPGKTYGATRELYTLHQQSCNEYAAWVVHNAQAALKTRDGEGKFGEWWGASLVSGGEGKGRRGRYEDALPRGARDYRNEPAGVDDDDAITKGDVAQVEMGGNDDLEEKRPSMKARGDVNDRGRGRTVETQGGGVAVVRAAWEFLRLYDEDG